MREAGLYKYRVFLCAVRLRLEEEGSPVSVGGFHPPFIFGNTITFVPFSIPGGVPTLSDDVPKLSL